MTKARDTASLVSSQTGIAVTISGDPVVLGIGDTGILRVFANQRIGVNTTLAYTTFDFHADEEVELGFSIRNTSKIAASRSSFVFYTSGDGITSPRAKLTSSDDENNKGYLAVLTRDGGSTERLRIRGTGDIGIGKTDPQQKVDILGNLGVDGDVGIGTSAVKSGALSLYNTDLEIESDSSSSNLITFRCHNSTSSNSIYFRDDTGAAQLGIRGAGTSRTNPGAATGMPQIFSFAGFDLYISADSSNSIFFTTNRNDRMEIRSDGGVVMNNVYSDVIASGRDLYISSGGRLGYLTSIGISKTNVSTLTNIDWIDQLRIVNFNYKKFTETTTGIGSTEQTVINYLDSYHEETEYGLIAEEVVGINTDLVFYNENTEGSKSLAGVHYKKLIPVLVKGLQDARSEINILKERLNNAGISS